MRIVLDTNILVRANAKARGPARELLQLIAASPSHTLLLSPFLLLELERVFDYERVRVSSKLTDEEIREYLSYLRANDVSEVVFLGPAPRVVPSDPDDDPRDSHCRDRPSRCPLYPEPRFLQSLGPRLLSKTRRTHLK